MSQLQRRCPAWGLRNFWEVRIAHNKPRRPLRLVAGRLEQYTRTTSLHWCSAAVMTWPARVWALANLLGEPDENALGASAVAEPIHVFVLDDPISRVRGSARQPTLPYTRD